MNPLDIFIPVLSPFRKLFQSAGNHVLVFALEQLGVFDILKMVALVVLALFAVRIVFGKSRKAVIYLILGWACFFEWTMPGWRTYSVPTSLSPTQQAITFEVSDRTLPGWADWLRQRIPGEDAGPKVTVTEGDDDK